MVVVLCTIITLSGIPVQTVCAKENKPWQNIYIDYLKNHYSDKKVYEAALIYVDGDKIPELYIKSPYDTCMGNEDCALLSISKNKVKESPIPNWSFKYAPKKNRIYYHQGMGTFIFDTTHMEKLEKGKAVSIWTSMKDADPTQLKQPVMYHINNKQVSKNYYKQYISKQTSKYKWKSVDKQLMSLSEVKTQLSYAIEPVKMPVKSAVLVERLSDYITDKMISEPQKSWTEIELNDNTYLKALDMIMCDSEGVYCFDSKKQLSDKFYNYFGKPYHGDVTKGGHFYYQDGKIWASDGEWEISWPECKITKKKKIKNGVYDVYVTNSMRTDPNNLEPGKKALEKYGESIVRIQRNEKSEFGYVVIGMKYRATNTKLLDGK